MKNSTNISPKRIKWIREQGYFNYSDQEIMDLKIGNRLAPQLCLTGVVIGLALSNVYILLAMTLIAFLTLVLPYHPFDYFYNGPFRKWMSLPKLPPRSAQLKFACGIASTMLAITSGLYLSGMTTAGFIVGASIIPIASLAAFMDFCIPSKIYNALFLNEKPNMA